MMDDERQMMDDGWQMMDDERSFVTGQRPALPHFNTGCVTFYVS